VHWHTNMCVYAPMHTQRPRLAHADKDMQVRTECLDLSK
jgi:hypothetical protein